MSDSMSLQRYGDISPKVRARIAGFLYLIVVIGGIFAEVLVRGRLVVAGDAAATAHNIAAHELLYRMGFAAELFYCLCNVPLALVLYDLFRIVNKPVAVMALAFGVVGTAVGGINLLADFAPLFLLGKSTYLVAFTEAQLQAATYLSLRFYETGFAISLTFFGFFCIAQAYLIVRSTFFPRVIGGLLALEGALYLVNSFATFIVPAIGAKIFPFLAVSGLGEVSFALWLLIVGVNAKRWREQEGEVTRSQETPQAA